MFTKWQHIEDWIRDNNLTSWRFQLDRSGNQTDTEGNTEQKRSNRIIVLSDALPGTLEEKLALTRKRLSTEYDVHMYGIGKRGRENTGMLYCEVRLVDELQQPGTLPVSSPAFAPVDEERLAERIRREVMLEYENQQYQREKKEFEQAKKEFEEQKAGTIGMLVQYFSPVISALANKRVAGIDATEPVTAAPIQVQEQIEDEIFTEQEQDKLFDLMARFKAVEPRYLELIEKVVVMAESGDGTYEMAKGMLLK